MSPDDITDDTLKHYLVTIKDPWELVDLLMANLDLIGKRKLLIEAADYMNKFEGTTRSDI